MSKAIARGSKKSLVDHCFNEPATFKYLKKKIGTIIRCEIKTMCSNKVNSVLRSSGHNSMKFKWSILIEEMNANAPLLLNILQSCISSNSANAEAVTCMCSSLIFFHRFKQMNLVQKLISLILYAGRAGKQVSDSLT